MEIRRAAPEDLEAVMALYDQGRAYMRAHGNQNQWINGYPSRELVAGDIRLGQCYLGLWEGAPAAVFCFFHGPDVEPAYAAIDGAWLDEGPYGVVHRIASSGRVPGVLERVSAWGLEQCGSLRVDTHRDNAPMRRALERCGYQYCGVVVIQDGTERVAYQKLAGSREEAQPKKSNSIERGAQL